MAITNNRVSVTDAAQYLRRDILSEAVLVVPDRGVGALLSVVQINARINRLATLIRSLSVEADLRAAKNRREADRLDRLASKRSTSRLSAIDGVGKTGDTSESKSGGGGGGGLLDKFKTGGIVGAGIKFGKSAIGAGIRLGKGALRFGGKFGGPLLGIAGTAMGAYDVSQDIKNTGKVGYLNAASTGASAGGVIGAGIGSAFFGVGAIPGGIIGAGIGAALGVGSAAVFNAREAIVEGYHDLTAKLSDAASSAKEWSIAKWDSVSKTWDNGYNYVTNSIKEGWKGLTDNVVKYSSEVSEWALQQGTNIRDWLYGINNRLKNILSTFDMKALASEWLRKLKDWVVNSFGRGQPAGAYAGNGPAGAFGPGGGNAFTGNPASAGGGLTGNPTIPTGPAPLSLPGRVAMPDGNTSWPGTGPMAMPNPGFPSIYKNPGLVPSGGGGAGGDIISRGYGERPEIGPVGANGAGLVAPVTGTITGSPGREYGAPRPGRRHSGIDWPARNNTPVVAMVGGQVLHVGYDDKKGGYGAYITILGDDKVIRRYAAHGAVAQLAIGSRVEQGQQIGVIDRDHLHYEEIPQTINGRPNPVWQRMVNHPGEFVSTSNQNGTRLPETGRASGAGVEAGKPLNPAADEAAAAERAAKETTVAPATPLTNPDEFSTQNAGPSGVTPSATPAPTPAPPPPPTTGNVLPFNTIPLGKPVNTSKMNIDPNKILQAAEEMNGLRAYIPAEAEKLYGYMRKYGIDINPRNTAWCSAGLGASVMAGGFNAPNNPAWAPNWEKWGRAVSTDKMKSGDVVYTNEPILGPDGKDTGKVQAGHVAIYAGMTRDYNGETYALVEASNTTTYGEDKSGLAAVNAENDRAGREHRTWFGSQNYEWIKVKNLHARRSNQADPNAKSYPTAKAKAFASRYGEGTNLEEALPFDDSVKIADKPSPSVSQTPDPTPPTTTIAEANGEKPKPIEKPPEKVDTSDYITRHVSHDSLWTKNIPSVPPDYHLAVKTLSDNA